MSTAAPLRLALRRAASPVTVGLRGPEGATVQPLADVAPGRVVGVMGPPGPAGGAVRFDVTSPSASWVIPHSFSRVPIVSVYLASGELVLADVFASATTINVVFASPKTGFVIAA